MGTKRASAWNVVIGVAIGVTAVFCLTATFYCPYCNPKEASKKTVCLSNMKQIGTAMMLYSADHDETLPLRRLASHPSALGWASEIEPLMHRSANYEPDSRFRCPVDHGRILS